MGILRGYIYLRHGKVCLGVTAVPMASSDSADERPILPSSPLLAPSRARGMSQDSGGGSGVDAYLTASGRVSKHSSRSGSRLRGMPGAASCPRPAVSQDSAPTAQWDIVLEALTELRREVNQLKADRGAASPLRAPVVTGVVPSPRSPVVNDGAGPSSGLPCGASPGNFSRFVAGASDEEGVSAPLSTDLGPLHQCAKVFGPPKVVSGVIDSTVADMVNFVFENGLCEEDHKAICEDAFVMRPSNCPALAPVECNPEILDALRFDARRTDFHLKEVNKDILPRLRPRRHHFRGVFLATGQGAQDQVLHTEASLSASNLTDFGTVALGMVHGFLLVSVTWRQKTSRAGAVPGPGSNPGK
ncbi:hypothetical protein E2C01_067875 [Portunus trituberculatus]|uniref:Uncharacterized protein n=1 Tax=Portunus trituberculatus TaxID=210409 RepID=A0A5B7HQH0_PORTR|nr:hypothetical protein [Portunus trituberculatus]